MEQSLKRQLKNAGETEALAELEAKPKVTRELLFWHNAYFELDTERSHGMGLTRIPRSRVIGYGRECGMRGTELYEFARIIRRADDAYLAELAKQMERK